ncbi:hypothetical protein [Brevundimonas sp.]|uniref:hypothetical protein n=1 Tax=Brevundimonas sp. TaxID=1871086 RepID=UPI0028A1BD40|nr:hypothetical protein [Brevundimonas sp.]
MRLVASVRDRHLVNVRGRLTIEERKTGIDQPDIELINALGELPDLRERPWAELAAMAHGLRSHVWDVSSLGLAGFVLDVHDVVDDLPQHLEQLRARRKRVDAEVMAVLTAPQSDVGELLNVAGFTTRESIPPGLGKMELKMAAGAISFADIDEMKDDVSSLESAFLRWKEKYGLVEANKRLSHFQYFAKRAAREAEKAASADGAPYGPAMFDALKGQAKAIHEHEQKTMFGCRSEHLVGAAGLLSEECSVWCPSNSPCRLPAGTCSSNDRRLKASRGCRGSRTMATPSACRYASRETVPSSTVRTS